jgi:hypothetical protein
MTTTLEGHVALMIELRNSHKISVRRLSARGDLADLMTELRNSHKILVRRPAARDELTDLINVRIVLKLVVDIIIWTGFM